MKYLNALFYLSTSISFILFLLIRYTFFFDGYLFSIFALLAFGTLIAISVIKAGSEERFSKLPWVFFLTLLIVAILLRIYVPSNAFR